MFRECKNVKMRTCDEIDELPRIGYGLMDVAVVATSVIVATPTSIPSTFKSSTTPSKVYFFFGSSWGNFPSGKQARSTTRRVSRPALLEKDPLVKTGMALGYFKTVAAMDFFKNV